MAAMAADGNRPLLGGERGGTKIEGFDLGNSPLEYTAEKVGRHTVVFTTTNGTRALLAVSSAERVYVGTFANLTAVADRLAAEKGDVNLVCAGTDGQVTLEDAAGAGAIAAALLERAKDLAIGNDEATIALALYLGYGQDATRLEALRSGRGGANLVSLGYDADIEFSSRIDSAPVLPVYRGGALVLEAAPAGPDGDAEWAI
jgi:2-phosphosulfolactate phosphatase